MSTASKLPAALFRTPARRPHIPSRFTAKPFWSTPIPIPSTCSFSLITLLLPTVSTSLSLTIPGPRANHPNLSSDALLAAVPFSGFLTWLSSGFSVDFSHQPEVPMKSIVGVSLLASALFFFASPFPEAPTGFDNKSNGLVDDATHAADQAKFEESEAVSEGLGPLYNAPSCRDCHQNPTSGGSSQVSELRVGHRGADGKFQNPEIPIGRFGWKDQQASLLSFSADAYLNEMGVTSRLQPDEVTNLCNTASEPNDKPGPDGLSDIDRFARFMRASEAPARDSQVAQTPKARRGAELFDKVGCDICHVQTLTTAPAGTKVNGGAFTVPPALADKQFHPYGDFLLHDVGTGDGFVAPMLEHYGKKMYQISWRNLSIPEYNNAANKIRTAPLWGVRLHSRLMHDGASVTLLDAILRHGGESAHVTEKFKKLNSSEKEALLEFLRSL